MSIKCELCFHHCNLAEGQSGFCNARQNIGGVIRSTNYGEITSAALDPIEKKPLKRFFPGSQIFSIGSFGCNLNCPFCQNDEISRARKGDVPTQHVRPEQIVAQAIDLLPQGNIGIAYTYNEPLISYEFVLDCARLARSKGLQNVLVTNGTIEAAPLEKLLPFIDAMNIDLKSFSAAFYKKLGGDLPSTQRTIQAAHAAGCHVEVTTLIIPGENDSDKKMTELTTWLAQIDPAIPYHISRFFPRYQMQDKSPTPVATIYHLKTLAEKQLQYVYTGNC